MPLLAAACCWVQQECNNDGLKIRGSVVSYVELYFFPSDPPEDDEKKKKIELYSPQQLEHW